MGTANRGRGNYLTSLRVQKAYRLNNNENARLNNRYGALEKEHIYALRGVNQEIRLLRMLLNKIQESSGISPEGWRPEDDHRVSPRLRTPSTTDTPLYMYGDRVGSRHVKRTNRVPMSMGRQMKGRHDSADGEDSPEIQDGDEKDPDGEIQDGDPVERDERKERPRSVRFAGERNRNGTPSTIRAATAKPALKHDTQKAKDDPKDEEKDGQGENPDRALERRPSERRLADERRKSLSRVPSVRRFTQSASPAHARYGPPIFARVPGQHHQRPGTSPEGQKKHRRRKSAKSDRSSGDESSRPSSPILRREKLVVKIWDRVNPHDAKQEIHKEEIVKVGSKVNNFLSMLEEEFKQNAADEALRERERLRPKSASTVYSEDGW
ncbi:Hypp8883 [Branchiostoma lanceolatum]|uniref:Hypp8883 protein n=1 Tax=Branchiostoma lanceolatum TaxID=7740 RepID=A0A8J9ZBI0_BRALA|nr:Hypp8883 [Branchiostoma lanceolatum]